MRSTLATVLAGGLLTIAAVFVPSAPLGFLDGTPADHPLDFFFPVVLAALLALCRRGRGPSSILLVLLLGLTAGFAGARWASHLAHGEHGLIACYETEVSPGVFELERSTRFRIEGASRIDPSIDFAGLSVGPGRNPLWTDFLNSTRKPARVEERLALPVRIRWTGYIRPGRECSLFLEVRDGGDGVLSPAPGEVLRPGVAHPLRVEARFPRLREPVIRLVTGDDRRPVPPSWLAPADRAWGSPALAAGLHALSWAILGGIIAILWRSRPAAISRGLLPAGGPAGYLLVGVALAAEVILWEHKLRREPAFHVLPPNDYLLYEEEARGLIWNGIAIDDGVAFHRSPAMRYYLAAAHALFGESGYGIMLFQQVLRGAAAVITLIVCRKLTGGRWAPGVAAVIVLFTPGAASLSLRWWPETPATLLLLLLALSEVHAESRSGGAALCSSAGTGLLAGTLTLVRPNALSLVPTLLAWILFRRGWGSSFAFLISAVACLSLVPIRNLIVTGEPVPFPTQGPLALIAGNDIPAGIDISSALTGDPGQDGILCEGLERLLDFSTNPRASFDPFPPRANAIMHASLLSVWRAYIAQYPARFIRQSLERAGRWLLPLKTDRAVLAITVPALLGILVLALRGGHLGAWALVLLAAAYSAPFILSYFEGRHRVVVLPLLVLLAVHGASVVLRRARPRASRFLATPPRRS